MKNSVLNRTIKVSILSAFSFVLMLIEFPLPVLFPGFLKFDFSDLPALVGSFALGPVEGVMIELIKNVLKSCAGSETVFVGELSNFIVGAIFVGVAGFIYRYRKTKKQAAISLLAGTAVCSLFAGMLNYYIFFPLFAKAFHAPIESFVKMTAVVNPWVTDFKSVIYLSVIPFNLFKFLCISIITFVIYKKISPLLHSEGVRVKNRAY